MGPFVHNIDPVLFRFGGFYIWWYGLSYTFGFLGVFFWFRRVRQELALSLGEVYSLTLFLAWGVLLGGRLVEVIFYEWPYYRSHPQHILAVWLGGMSTHGIILGAVAGMLGFCYLYKKPVLPIADVLAIAGAYVMGVGRIGNFIDGQIAGSMTNVWWAVKFPDLEGYRHPVVLYDGIKNLLLVPVLLMIRKNGPPRGVVLAHFILWYGFLRIFVDLFREYRIDWWGLPPGQGFNISMTLLGVGLLVWFLRKKDKSGPVPPEPSVAESSQTLRIKRVLLILVLLLPSIIPSDWTQDVPARYGNRHPGLEHSLLYPEIQAPVTSLGENSPNEQ